MGSKYSQCDFCGKAVCGFYWYDQKSHCTTCWEERHAGESKFLEKWGVVKKNGAKSIEKEQ